MVIGCAYSLQSVETMQCLAASDRQPSTPQRCSTSMIFPCQELHDGQEYDRCVVDARLRDSPTVWADDVICSLAQEQDGTALWAQEQSINSTIQSKSNAYSPKELSSDRSAWYSSEPKPDNVKEAFMPNRNQQPTKSTRPPKPAKPRAQIVRKALGERQERNLSSGGALTGWPGSPDRRGSVNNSPRKPESKVDRFEVSSRDTQRSRESDSQPSAPFTSTPESPYGRFRRLRASMDSKWAENIVRDGDMSAWKVQWDGFTTGRRIAAGGAGPGPRISTLRNEEGGAAVPIPVPGQTVQASRSFHAVTQASPSLDSPRVHLGGDRSMSGAVTSREGNTDARAKWRW
eukprot:2957893-Rhodomonas_salina.1